MASNIKCHLVEEAGQRFFLRVFWGGKGTHGQEYGYHNAMKFIRDYPYAQPVTNYEEAQNKYPSAEITRQEQCDDYKGQWPTSCSTCKEPVPPFQGEWKGLEGNPCYQYFYATLYREVGTTETPRMLKEGDMFWAWWMPTDLDKRGHLMVVCPGEPLETDIDVYYNPDGRIWDTMSTATNCQHGPNAGSHYCWTRTGEPPNCTIRASILIGKFHGFVTNGEIVGSDFM